MKPTLFAAVLFLTATTFATPSFAVDGRNAVGRCIDTPGCTYAVGKNGKDIEILAADGTYIYCADATSECVIPRRVVKPQTHGVTLGTSAGAIAR